MNEQNELLLYLNVRVPKDVAEQEMSAKDVLKGMRKELESLKDFKTAQEAGMGVPKDGPRGRS